MFPNIETFSVTQLMGVWVGSQGYSSNFFSRETLLLSGSHDPAINDKGSGRIMIKRTDAKNRGHRRTRKTTPAVSNRAYKHAIKREGLI